MTTDPNHADATRRDLEADARQALAELIGKAGKLVLEMQTVLRDAREQDEPRR